jgi:nucleoside-diphosphate-sugar epimerase
MGTSSTKEVRQHRFLIWGGDGWIAGHLKTLLETRGKDVYTTMVRMEDREAVLRELIRIQPTHVLNAAGCTGRPNVDWCEDHKEATIRSNVIGTLNLADCCFLRHIHCTVFATGCIYQYDEMHPLGGPAFVETDPANFAGSFYSMTKAHVEEVTCSDPRSLAPSLSCNHADLGTSWQWPDHQAVQ